MGRGAQEGRIPYEAQDNNAEGTAMGSDENVCKGRKILKSNRTLRRIVGVPDVEAVSRSEAENALERRKRWIVEVQL